MGNLVGIEATCGEPLQTNYSRTKAAEIALHQRYYEGLIKPGLLKCYFVINLPNKLKGVELDEFLARKAFRRLKKALKVIIRF